MFSNRQTNNSCRQYPNVSNCRCMAAKQKLTKGRLRARQKKMQQIAKLLDMNISSTSLTPGLPMPLLGPSGSIAAAGPGSHRLLSRSGSTSSDSSHLPGAGTGRSRASVPSTSSHFATEYAFYEAQRVFGYGRQRQLCKHEQQPSQREHAPLKASAPVDGKRSRALPRSLINKVV